MKNKIFLLLLVSVMLCLVFAFSVSAQEHNLTEAYTYDNGFTSNGTYSSICSCQNSDCELNATSKEMPPLFVIDGFSSLEDDSESICMSYSYKANVEAIEKYEQVNNCKITYGYLLASEKNFKNNPEKVVVNEFDKHYRTVDVRLNYGTPNENGQTGYNKSDVIFAGAVSVNQNGTKTTSYFQLSLPTKQYESEAYGSLYGINYDVVTKKQNSLMVWYDNRGMEDRSGQLNSIASARTVSETYIKVGVGDTISLPASKNVLFILYGYNLVDGQYQYAGYIDCNRSLGTNTTNENWNTSYEFMDGDTIGTSENGRKAIDYNNFYVRILFKPLSGSTLSYKNFADDIVYNLIEDPTPRITVTFKNDSEITSKTYFTGDRIGTLPTPSRDGYIFMGWYDENDTNHENTYTSGTVLNSSVTLVPYFVEKGVSINEFLVWADNTTMHDGAGTTQAPDKVENSRVTVTSYIRVNVGDTISIPRDAGYRFIIYCYNGESKSYVNNSYIDCNKEDNNTNAKNWGYSYTFFEGEKLGNGSTISFNELYIRIVFRKDDNGANGTLYSNDFKHLVSFDITADNSHLFPDLDTDTTPDFEANEIFTEKNIISHRGYNTVAPENTMSAFQLALEKGLKIIEVDIHVTKDGIPVALHDNTIDRTSNGSGNIANLTYAEASQYNYNYGKSAYSFEKLPTLQEIVDFCKENDLCLELDLANRGFTAEQKKAIYDVIADNDFLPNTMFTATNNELQGYMSLNDSIIVSVSGIQSVSGVSTMANYKTCALAFASVGAQYVTAEIVDAVHEMGMLVKTWTVNSESDAQRLASLGVDAIISDSLTEFPNV